MARKAYQKDLALAITKLIDEPALRQASTGRGRGWRPDLLIKTWLLMSWSTAPTLIDRFETARRWLGNLGKRALPRTYRGFAKALHREAERLMPVLLQALQQKQKALAGNHWLRAGWCAITVDGTRFETPRTQSNETALGCAGRSKTTPQLFMTVLWHMGIGLPWAYRIGPGTDSERQHCKEMIDELPAQTLLVADAGFAGYDLCAKLLLKGHHFLLRVGGNLTLLRDLGYWIKQGSDTIYLWPESQRKRRPLVLRLIVLQDGKQPVYLITSVLDKERLDDAQACQFYQQRWGVEVFFRGSKQTLQRRKMLSRSAALTTLELHGCLFGIWLLGLLAVEPILKANKDPLSFSVALARRHAARMLEAKVKGGPHVYSNQMAAAVHDTYQRQRPKKARNWPHRKKEPPCGPPKIRPATLNELQAAQQFTAFSVSAQFAA